MLMKMGWRAGKGLGKDESGMTAHVKVSSHAPHSLGRIRLPHLPGVKVPRHCTHAARTPQPFFMTL